MILKNLWKLLLVLIIVFATFIVGTGVYKGFVDKNNQTNSTRGLLPYYSIAVNLEQNNNSSPIEIKNTQEIDLKLKDFDKTRQISSLFSSQGEKAIIKTYSLDLYNNRSYNQLSIVDLANNQILEQTEDKNVDYFFNSQNELVKLKKNFYENQNLNHSIEVSISDKTIFTYKSPKTDHGSVWQIFDHGIYFSKKDYLILHLYDPLDDGAKQLIKVIKVSDSSEIYSFEARPFNRLMFDKNQDYIYTIDDNRFDAEIFNLKNGKKFNIDNQSFISASDILNHNDGNRLVTNSDSTLNLQSSGKFMPIGEQSDQILKIWDIDKSGVVDTMSVTDEPLVKILTTQNLKTLITGSKNGNIQFIDTNLKKAILTLKPNTSQSPNSQIPFHINISPDDSKLIAIGNGGKLFIWNIELQKDT